MLEEALKIAPKALQNAHLKPFAQALGETPGGQPYNRADGWPASIHYSALQRAVVGGTMQALCSLLREKPDHRPALNLTVNNTTNW